MSLASIELEDASALLAPAVETPVKHLRVLHVINGEHYAGAERVQDHLAQRLPEFGFDVGFACLKPHQFPHLRQARNVPLYEVPMNGRFDLRPVRRLVELIRREGYSLIHTHTARSAMVGRMASARADVPMVHHLHSPTTFDTLDKWRNWMNVAAERFSLLGVDAVITVSSSLERYAHKAGIPPARVTVVPNGVPTRGPLVERALPRGVWTLGVVALFRPRKGLEVLLHALTLLRSQGKCVRLRAVGAFETPEYEAEVKGMASRLGVAEAIDWRGFTRDVNAELATMDLFILPSLFGEGLPMVILEAMAAGVPIVGTRVEGVPEAIRDNVDGVIAEPNDPQSLARAIARVMQGEAEWQSLRASAHARQAERFSDRSMASAVAAVYDRVLGRAGRG
jgi:glycosyltransferase involved in cell wall biosynthesis